MKRCLLLIVLLAVVVPVAGLQIDFQQSSDMASLNSTYGTCTWAANGSGGNSLVNCGGGTKTRNANPEVSSYFSVYVSGIWEYRPYALDGELNQVYGVLATGAGLWELTYTGGRYRLYQDGILRDNRTGSPMYYAGFTDNGHGYGFDHWVYGSTEDREMMSIPDGNVYEIVKDIGNPANTGLAYISNDTVFSPTSMDVFFSRSALDSVENKTISMWNVLTNTLYQTRYTGTEIYGTVSFNLTEFSEVAPYGLYEIRMEDSGTETGAIVYRSKGATIYFDRDSYSRGDTATLTYTIEDDTWPLAHDYSVEIISATYGTLLTSIPISTKNGTVTYTWEDEELAGTYYGILKGETSSDSDVWLALDWADLDAYVTFYGYVMNQDGTVLSGANVSVTQGDLYDNEVTIADGNYTVTGFYSGAATTLNVTASGYSQYLVSLTPLAARRIPLNITLNTTTPTVTGLGIGGVARDGIFNDTTRAITMGYGRPLSGATVYLWNFSTNQTYTKQTNIAGWYLCDDGSSCALVPGRIYDVQARKGGYNNSQNYTVVTS